MVFTPFADWVSTWLNCVIGSPPEAGHDSRPKSYRNAIHPSHVGVLDHLEGLGNRLNHDSESGAEGFDQWGCHASLGYFIVMLSMVSTNQPAACKNNAGANATATGERRLRLR